MILVVYCNYMMQKQGETHMTNLFATAKTIPAKKTVAGKPAKPEIRVEGLALYAEIDALEKTLAALKETAKTQVHSVMKDYFVANGPENFKGVDGLSTASLELRKRSSTSALNEPEQLLMAANGIPMQEVEDRPETFIINPDYKDDAALLKKASAALSKVKDLPSDFLQYQQSTKKIVTTEDSINQIFKLNDKDRIRELLSIVGTLAVKPKTAKPIEEIVDTIREFVSED
jgi:hypothetical protein